VGRYFDAADMEMPQQSLPHHNTALRPDIWAGKSIGRELRMGELTFTVIWRVPGARGDVRLSDIQENSVIIRSH